MKYLKQFIIGSSYLVFLPYFYAVQKSQSRKNYTYFTYTLIAPIWLGLWNVISLIIAERFNLSMKMRFLVVSIISSLCIMLISTYAKAYDFNKDEWKKYYFYIFIMYLIVWNLIVYNIERHV